jgi:hypothetical protein
MKIRFHQQEVRVRLGLTEVAALCDGRQIHSQLVMGPLPEQTISFVVRPEHSTKASISYTPNNFIINMPLPWLAGWLDDSREGFEHMQQVTRNHHVRVLVQKDYICRHPEDDEKDMAAQFEGGDTFEWNRADVTAFPFANPKGGDHD